MRPAGVSRSRPGGQKRNKSSNAVRLIHRPTGIATQATDSRSLSRNQQAALHKMRLALALASGTDPATVTPSGDGELLRAHTTLRESFLARPDGARVVTALLAAFVAHGCSVRDTAASLGLSSARLSKLLTSHPRVLETINRLRHEAGLKPLRAAH